MSSLGAKFAARLGIAAAGITAALPNQGKEEISSFPSQLQ